MAETFANKANTTLAANTDNSQTYIVVDSSSGFPSAGSGNQFRITIDNEILIVTAISGVTWTVTRGAESTTATSHTSGAAVDHVLTVGSVTSLASAVLSLDTETTSTVTLTSTSNRVQLADATSNIITYNLPAASGNTGLFFYIKKIDSSSNNVIIDGSGSETIDGVTTKTLTTPYTSVKIVCDGSNWYII